MTSATVEDDKHRSVVTEHQHQPPPPFQVQGLTYSNYPPPPQQPPTTGFPQTAQPYVADGGRPETEHHALPCCGIGIGWVLFILGFLLGAIPWYIGFFLLLFSKNRRERPGYIACSIGSFFVTIFIIVEVIRGSGVWS